MMASTDRPDDLQGGAGGAPEAEFGAADAPPREWGAGFTWLRRLPDRLLHPWRRKAAIDLLRDAGTPAEVLFVCTGNLYRSPYAALQFEKLMPEALRGRVRVRSAGFVGADRPCLPDAVNHAAAEGIDLSDHRSVPLNHSMVSEADLIVVMEPVHLRILRERFPLRREQRIVILGDLDPEPVDMRTIADPWQAGPGVLEQSYARVERCVRALIRALE